MYNPLNSRSRLEGGFFIVLNGADVTDLERKLWEQVVGQLEKQPGVSDDDKREMRETLLAMKLLERLPQASKTAIWQDSRFWAVLLALVALLASALGLEIPRDVFGGKS
ncbi:MAG: hypothetical protein HC933_00750 [Pleurocapsa sp. SU_196_0]|nr:hypothetical protein [Pleurocapsa sp. SU_196_0]